MGRAYRIEADLLVRLIPPNSTGVYILGVSSELDFVPVYVGRSDTCLLTRLLTHNHRDKATHVVWRLTSNMEQAFKQECCYFHTYEDQQILNQVHPASPKGSGLVCPICQFCDEDVKALVQRKEK